MNEILKVKQLEFHPSGTNTDGQQTYTAYTPFGTYEYRRINESQIIASCQFSAGQSGDIVRCGNAVTAQRICNSDYTMRIRESLGLDHHDD